MEQILETENLCIGVLTIHQKILWRSLSVWFVNSRPKMQKQPKKKRTASLRQFGPKASRQKTETKIGEKVTDISLLRLITKFRKHFARVRNIIAEAIFCGQNLSQLKHWKKLRKVGKDCEFKKDTPIDVMVFKSFKAIVDTK